MRNQIRPIQELKKGNRILFYSQVFLITKDAYLVADQKPNYHTGKMENLKDEDKVYYAPCVIENKEKLSKNVCSLLLNYNGFQGNSRAKQQVL